ncbi:MAG: hypothetical protein U0K48_06010 [Bacilli bacterium]|jgi:hypothetical protein|nr:hypothetical protein [Bacilli bacterium]DAI22337.1 MAG TPA: hypothetical protein [Caudoviricetes sp.]
MKNEVLKKVAKLIDLKSIMTIIMVIALVVGWFADKVTSEQFIPMVMMIMTFYFAKNDKKGSDSNE